VGDPSGRDETRKLLTYEQIDANKESIKARFRTSSGSASPGTAR